MIDAAIEAGTVAELHHKNMSVALRVGRRNVKLVGGDGLPTREGLHYYSKLEVPPPAIYPNEKAFVMASGLSASMERSMRSSA